MNEEVSALKTPQESVCQFSKNMREQEGKLEKGESMSRD